MVTDKVIRAENKLERLVAEGHITPEGMAAFIAATDPFHDTGIVDLCGWPDLETNPSVIRCVKKSVVVSPPEAGGSVHLYTFPVIDTSICSSTSRRNCVIDSINVSVQVPVAPVVINTYKAVNADNMTMLNYTTSQTLDIDSSYLTNPTRVIGWGFEIRDVTAELYKQGVITTYLVPQSQDQTNTFTIKAQTVNGLSYLSTVQDGKILQPFPHNLASALLYEGSRQWQAKEGCYAVIPFSAKDNIARSPEYFMPCVRNSDSDAETIGAINSGTLHIGPWLTGGQTGDNFVFTPHMYTPMHSKGAICSGLAAQSTFQVNVVWFLETFPTKVTDPLITLSRPSAAYDPVAIEMIARTMKDMPVAVPVAENGLGDFFLELVEKIAPIVGGLASVAFPEFAPLIGTVAGGARAMAAKSRNNRAEKRKKKKPNKPPKIMIQNDKIQDVKLVKVRTGVKPNSQGGAKMDQQKKKRARARKNQVQVAAVEAK